MLTIQRITAVSISFLYVYFVHKLIWVFWDLSGKKSTKGLLKYADEKNLASFFFTMLAGLLAMLVAFYSDHSEFKISAALSSFMCIFSATLGSWGQFRDEVRLILAGILLVALSTLVLRN